MEKKKSKAGRPTTVVHPVSFGITVERAQRNALRRLVRDAKKQGNKAASVSLLIRWAIDEVYGEPEAKKD